MKQKFLHVRSNAFSARSVTTLKELWEKASAEGYEGMSIACSVELTKDVESKKFHAIFSSASEDRHGEIVYQDFDLKAFKKNPVYLDSHQYDSIEHIIGKISPLSIKDGKLQGDIEFATMNPKGQLAEQMADAGFLNTSSIGFIPKSFDDKGNILTSELLEISAVSVPANPEALFEKAADADAVVDEPVAEPDAPVEEPGEIVGEQRVSPREVAASAIRGMNEDHQRNIKAIARALGSINEPGERKRQLLQSVRSLLKADTHA
jgi:hypothetical protein